MLLKDFYSVTKTTCSGENFITEIKINKDHPLFKGHFPGRPVTPGVILMQLFKEEAERQTGSKLRLQKASNIKFLSVVDPGIDENFILESKIEEEAGVIKLKGIAQHNKSTALKISTLYVVL